MSDITTSGSWSASDWIGAAQAIADVAVAGINSGSSKRSQKRARRYNEELMRIQDELADQNALDAYNRQLEAWNLANEYNKPSSVMQRLDEAGLNPNLVYGNGQGITAAGSLSPVPSAEVGASSVGTPTLGIQSPNLLAAAQAKELYSRSNLQDAQTGHEEIKKMLTQSQTWLNGAAYLNEMEKARGQSILNYIQEQSAPATIGQAFANLEQTWQNTLSLAKDVERKTIENKYVDQAAALNIADMQMGVLLKGAQTLFKLKGIEVADADIAAAYAVARLRNSQTRDLERYMDAGGSEARAYAEKQQGKQAKASARYLDAQAKRAEDANRGGIGYADAAAVQALAEERESGGTRNNVSTVIDVLEFLFGDHAERNRDEREERARQRDQHSVSVSEVIQMVRLAAAYYAD